MSDTKYVIDRDTLVNVGNAIRTKKGTSAQIPVTDLASEILSIPSGSEWTFEEGIVQRKTSMKIEIKVSKQITAVKMFCCLCEDPLEIYSTTRCAGMIWIPEFTSNYSLFGDAASNPGNFKFEAYQGVSFSGDTITLTAKYNYRTFPDVDYVWRILYK